MFFTSQSFRRASVATIPVLAWLLVPMLSVEFAQAADDFEAPPILYSKSTPDNPISRLQRRLDSGQAALRFENHFGYLRDVLKLLDVPTSSQTLVFSKTSLQRQRISPDAPRSLYFNDEVYIGMCQDGEVLEISAADPKLGTVFYTLEQFESAQPKFVRQIDNCTICHASSATRGVPGHTIRSVYVDAAGNPLFAEGSFRTDHTSPFKDRWGGWYVTGRHGTAAHMGNRTFKAHRIDEALEDPTGSNVVSLKDRFDTAGFLTPHSDLVALMILEHQTEGHNRITAANFQTRQALHYENELNRELGEQATKRWDSTNSRIRGGCEPLVQYLLMCDEAPLESPIAGTSDFAAEFAVRGPRDSQGRSLRDLDLNRRLFKYPLSYLIYSPSFDALPREALDHVYRRLWEVVSGAETDPEFAHLTPADRRAIAEIVAATKSNVPGYWDAAAVK